MVSIGKKTYSELENLSLLSKKLSKEGLDDIFAELFSLVNLDSVEGNKKNLTQNIDTKGHIGENFLIKDDEKSLEAAKSLISIFYKDLGMEDEQVFEESETSLKNEPKSSDNLLTHNDSKNINITGSNQNHGIHDKKNTIPVYENIIRSSNAEKNKTQNKEIINLLKVNNNPKKKFDNPSKENLTILEKKEVLINKRKDNHLLQNVTLPSKQLDNKKNEISQKKERKKTQRLTNIKIDVNYSNPGKNINISKDELIGIRKINTNVKKGSSAISSEKVNQERTNIIKNSHIKDSFHNVENHDQEVLDLLESSWGEKFVRTMRENIKNGNYKVDISLEPKNLGKLKVEVEINGEKTEVKINTESRIAANILNENHQKLSEMLERDQLKLGYFSSMMNDQRNSKNGSEKDRKDFSAIKESKEKTFEEFNEERNSKKTIHNVDINA